MVIKIEIQGMDEVFTYVRKLPEKLDKELSKGNESFMKDLRRSSSFRAPRSSGATRKSFKIERTNTKGKEKQWRLITKEPYVYWIIHGRRPGRAPPIQAIMNWKKLNPSKVGQTDDYSAAMILAKHIGKYGTMPNDFISRALDHTLTRWNDEFGRRVERALK